MSQSGYEPSPKICRFITNSLSQNPKKCHKPLNTFWKISKPTSSAESLTLVRTGIAVYHMIMSELQIKARAERKIRKASAGWWLSGRCYVAKPTAYEKTGSFYCKPDLSRISEGVNTSPRIWLWLSFCLHGFWWQLIPRWQARIW